MRDGNRRRVGAGRVGIETQQIEVRFGLMVVTNERRNRQVLPDALKPFQCDCMTDEFERIVVEAVREFSAAVERFDKLRERAGNDLLRAMTGTLFGEEGLRIRIASEAKTLIRVRQVTACRAQREGGVEQ